MAHRHVSTIFRGWFLLLQLIWTPSGAVGTTAISTECPDKFNDGYISTIWCYIDPVAVLSSGCLSTPTEVSLTFFNTAGKVTTLCSTSYGTCQNSTNCGCENSSDSMHTYWFSFTANKNSYSGGNLTCAVNCGYTPETNNTKGCQTVAFADTTSSPETPEDLIVGVTIGGFLFVVLCVLAGVLLYQMYTRRKKSKPATQNSTANPGDNTNKG